MIIKQKAVKILAVILLLLSLTSCYIPLNGLHENDIGTRYFVNDVYQTGWIKIDGKERYFSRVNGYMVTESQEIEGQWYGINPDGTRIDGFYEENGEKRYYVDGIYQIGWQEIDEEKYYFAMENGIMVTGQYTISGVVHTFSDDGKYTPVNGFQNDINGTRYYINDIYQIGWQEIEGNKYYFSKVDGYLLRGSQTIEGQWYGITNDGKLANGFLEDVDGTRYYNENGIYLTGWQNIEGEKYYFVKDTGIMVTGEYQIAGVTYTFSQNGMLIE